MVGSAKEYQLPRQGGESMTPRHYRAASVVSSGYLHTAGSLQTLAAYPHDSVSISTGDCPRVLVVAGNVPWHLTTGFLPRRRVVPKGRDVD